MGRQGLFVAILCLLFTVAGLAQTTAQLPAVSVAFPTALSSVRVWIQYVLYGPFGAYGNTIVGKPGSQLLRIPAGVKGKPVGRVKMFAWAPGCKIESFDIPLRESSDVQESYACNPLPTVSLAGQVSSTHQHGKKRLQVSVDYLASWSCGFFELADCMIFPIPLGTAILDPQGMFQVELPDFSADPTSSEPNGGTELQLVLREVKTGNLIAFLEPDLETFRSSGHRLKIASSYLEDMVFLVRKVN